MGCEMKVSAEADERNSCAIGKSISASYRGDRHVSSHFVDKGERRYMYRIIATLVLILPVQMALADHHKVPDAATADPKHYTVEFENDVIRIVRDQVWARRGLVNAFT